MADVMLSFARRWIPLALCGLAAACSAPACSAPAPIAASSATLAAPQAPTVAARLDSLLTAAWQKDNLAPTALADDATFYRRLSLDLLGVLPAPPAVLAFMADAAPDKRRRAVDAMLDDPGFSERFAVIWTDSLLGEGSAKKTADPAAFRSWLRARMEKRTPWDAIVREIIAGEGRSSPGGARRDRAIATHASKAEPENEGVHGSVNYLLPYRNTVEDLAGKTSRAFLGMQIQCAQCHDHKTEAWTTDQFRGFAAAFVKTRAVPAGAHDKGEMKVYDVQDQRRAKLGKKAPEGARAIAGVTPRALDGSTLDPASPRKALADWITAKQNPTFAKAFVNRTWAQLLGSGFVEPVDDFRPGNPVTLPEALDLLASDFIAGGFDVRRLVRTVCLSEAYQRSAGPPAKLWASFALRPQSAMLLFDAVVTATGLGALMEEVAGDKADVIRAQTRQRFVLVLDVDEDAGTHQFEGSIAHALLLSNGAVTRVGASLAPGGALEQIVRGPGTDTDKLDALYLRTLSRRPGEAERATWQRFLAEAEARGMEPKGRPVSPLPRKADPIGRLARRLQSTARSPREQAYEDIFWALLNASEMALQH